MDKKKTTVIIIAVVGVIGLLIGGYFWLSQEKPEKYIGSFDKITLATYKGEENLLLHIAKGKGFFEKNGLEVEIKYFETCKLCCDALIKGDVDICTSSDGTLVSYSFNLNYLRVLGTISESDNVALVARKDKGISTPGNLKGKKIGLTRESVGEYYLGTFLLFNNLSFDEVEVVDLKPSEIVEALVNGDIDAGFTWAPFVTNAKVRLADNAIKWPGQSGQPFYFIVLTTEDWVNKNKAAAKRFLKSLIDAEDYIKNNRVAAKKFLDKSFNHADWYDKTVWAQHKFVVKLPQTMLLQFENIARWRIKNKLTDAKEVPNYLDYIYMGALKELKPKAVTIIH